MPAMATFAISTGHFLVHFLTVQGWCDIGRGRKTYCIVPRTKTHNVMKRSCYSLQCLNTNVGSVYTILLYWMTQCAAIGQLFTYNTFPISHHSLLPIIVLIFFFLLFFLSSSYFSSSFSSASSSSFFSSSSDLPLPLHLHLRHLSLYSTLLLHILQHLTYMPPHSTITQPSHLLLCFPVLTLRKNVWYIIYTKISAFHFILCICVYVWRTILLSLIINSFCCIALI